MKVLVTGAAGFIGSHVAEAFVEMGHTVIGVDDLSSGSEANLHPAIRFERLDVTGGELAALIERERPDVIDHHAAQVSVRASCSDPIHDIRINVLGTVALAQAAIKSGVRRMIFASTGGAIYGEQQAFPANESHPTEPSSPYGASKLAAEKYLRCLAALSALELVVLRYSNVYGPRQSPHGEAGVVAIFTTRLLQGTTPTINGDGQQTRDYVFVEDVAQANRLALSQAPPGIYNIGTGIETTVNEIFHRLRVLTGASVEEIHGPGKPGEQRRSVIDASHAAGVLGWAPRVDLAAGLARTVEFFRKRPDSRGSMARNPQPLTP